MDSLIQHRLEADRFLAEKLEEGYKALGENAINTIENLYLGIQRLSWYSSCTLNEYKDICSQLKNEDLRALQNIKNHIFDHRMVYKRIIELFFEKIINKLPPEEVDRIKTRLLSSTIKGLTGLAANFAAKGTTNRTLVYGLASAFYINANFALKTSVHLKIIRIMGILELYGLLQKRLQANHRLQSLDPDFYQVLRYYHLEDMYFLVEPGLKKYLGYGRPTKAEDFLMMIKELLS